MSNRDFLCNPLYYVEVMRLKYAETLNEWCCVELSHVLDFSGTDGLGQILMGNVDVRQGKTIIRKFTRHKKKATPQPQFSVFGAPLSEDGYIQARHLIDYLKENVHMEGLFRIPGNSHRQQRLKEAINQRRTMDLESSEFTPHDVACVLKSFLSELPEPLLTDKHYGAHIQAADMTYKLEILPHHTPEMLGRLRATRTTAQVSALRYLFLMLQPPAYKLLRDVLELLHSVAENEQSNKMNASSLGILLAPHILWPRFLTTEDLKDQTYINKMNYAVEFMISYFTSIFKVPDQMLKKCEVFVKNGGKMPEDEEDKITTRQRAKSMDELDECSRRLPIGRPEPPSITVQNTRSYTQDALAQLYADVQSMPESSKKRKLMKQDDYRSRQQSQKFVDSSHMPGTPTKVRDDAVQVMSQDRRRRHHRRSRSAGDVIMKLGTPFGSRKKRLAPNPPPQTVLASSCDREIRDDLRQAMNDLNSENRRRADTPNTPGRSSQDMNIPTPAPRSSSSLTPSCLRSSQRQRKAPSTSQDRQARSTHKATPTRGVLRPHSSENITPTRKAPTAPPKKYSPYIAPPKSHSSPKEMEKPARPALPPPRSHSSPKDMDLGVQRQRPSGRTPVPAPRTSTPPVCSAPRKRRSDGQPVDSPRVVDGHPGSARRPVAKPRIPDNRPILHTAV